MEKYPQMMGKYSQIMGKYSLVMGKYFLKIFTGKENTRTHLLQLNSLMSSKVAIEYKKGSAYLHVLYVQISAYLHVVYVQIWA